MKLQALVPALASSDRAPTLPEGVCKSPKVKGQGIRKGAGREPLAERLLGPHPLPQVPVTMGVSALK